MATLNELSEQLELAAAIIESDPTPENQRLAQGIVDEIIPQIESKIDAYTSVIKSKLELAETRKQRAKSIMELACSAEKTAYWLKQNLQSFLEQRVEQLGEKGKRLEGIESAVTLCKAGGKVPVQLPADLLPDDVPEEFRKVIVDIDTEALKEACRNSKTGTISHNNKIIAAVKERSNYLRIK
ncbi:siphovirus Gp157 family protein [Ancylothrix sp. C2]|uniref:siphovirus Gp157 family protein n=1 Tax=Ancylothrix sp. D3o TaxID=2953691 RepID=UPI0021BB7CF2|nr:siphovirus Gp157 family protein [Ancylothrix sp. D3o]MCT7953364.1 siphovirus Gp157 family protein [Ancylothrix sp. D3o]